MRVVRHDKRKARFLVQAQNALVDNSLVTDAVILQFQIKVLRAKDIR